MSDEIPSLPGEEWRDVADYEGLYKVSNMGRVWSLPRTVIEQMSGGGHRSRRIAGRILKPSAAGGYPLVCLARDGRCESGKVHRLVALAFLPNPESKPEVNHINGVKTDNRAANLEWVTRAENADHAGRAGLKKKSRVLTEDQVREVVGRLRSQSSSELGWLFGVNGTTIQAIRSGRTWRGVSGLAPKGRNLTVPPNAPLTP